VTDLRICNDVLPQLLSPARVHKRAPYALATVNLSYAWHHGNASANRPLLRRVGRIFTDQMRQSGQSVSSVVCRYKLAEFFQIDIAA
jgi:hypothetical protein